MALAHQTSAQEDDWETLVDLAPEELLSPVKVTTTELSLDSLPQSSNTATTTTTNRRGRGKFSYKGQGLYSDNLFDRPDADDYNYGSETDPAPVNDDLERRDLAFGTCHVMVLDDLPLSTKTTDLEKLLVNFKDNFVIRWAGDRTSLAVFRNADIAHDAMKSISCPFKIRILKDDDEEILKVIKPSDLRPPSRRPPSDARAANRMIAQELKVKLPSKFGIGELRKQEAERKERIALRQNKKEEAWGSD